MTRPALAETYEVLMAPFGRRMSLFLKNKYDISLFKEKKNEECWKMRVAINLLTSSKASTAVKFCLLQCKRGTLRADRLPPAYTRHGKPLSSCLFARRSDKRSAVTCRQDLVPSNSSACQCSRIRFLRTCRRIRLNTVYPPPEYKNK